jgi:conjugative transfer region protein (TIGR03750 family)
MSGNHDIQRDGTVTFLPHHLNRQPVVVRGLTIDELWACVGIAAITSLTIGIPLAWLAATLAVIPTVIVATIAVGVFAGGGALRRHKRGRPDTWLYRQLQWWIALRHPTLAAHFCSEPLVIRSGYWTTRRMRRLA